MNKAQMIERLAPKINKTQIETREILNAVLETIEEGLVENKTVLLVGFGTFFVKNRAERLGRNPKTGESVKIEAKQTVTFKVGKALNEKINIKPKSPKGKKKKAKSS